MKALILLSFVIAFWMGWIANIFAAFDGAWEHFTLSVVGIVVLPLGAVTGWIYML